SMRGELPMSGKRLSIGKVMMLIALAAISLAVLRAVPLKFLLAPTIWFFIGLIDLVITWKLILGRRMAAFHYTALVVVIFGLLVLTYHASLGSTHYLAIFVRAYQQLEGQNINNIIMLEYLAIGEIWAAAFLSLLLAFTAGLIAAQLERRLGWDIAAFWRG